MFEVKQQTSNNKLSRAISQSFSKKNKGSQRLTYINWRDPNIKQQTFMGISQVARRRAKLRKALVSKA